MDSLAETLFVLIWVGGCVLGTAFWIWMLIDCAKNEPRKGNDRIVWVLIIVISHVLGALIYYFARRPERIRAQGQ